VTATGSSDLISRLRSRLSDESADIGAFSLSVTGRCRSALLEITGGVIICTIEAGEDVQHLRLNTNMPQYSTVGRVIDELKRRKGYAVTVHAGVNEKHSSADLCLSGIEDISGSRPAELRHRRFSDSELLDYLNDAIAFHNPTFTLGSVPADERPYVLLKAVARAYRVLAGDTAKRRGLDTDAQMFLTLAQDADNEYEASRRRMGHVIAKPQVDESKVGSGDVMEGKLFRRSGRSGYAAPYRVQNPPTPPELYVDQHASLDIADTLVRLRWSVSRDYSFARYELWRDTRPNVNRSLNGRIFVGTAGGAPGLPAQTQFSQAGTAKQVYGMAYGISPPTPTFDGFYFGTASEQQGSLIASNTFTDGIVIPAGIPGMWVLGEPLEPETDYYYRLYTIDRNGEVLSSNELRVRTLALRAKVKRTEDRRGIASDALSATSGTIDGGETLTIKGTNILAGTKVTIGGKLCAEVSRTTTEIVVTTPAFYNQDMLGRYLDIVLESPSGLLDIVSRGWHVTT
jgi:hypothetical protein